MKKTTGVEDLIAAARHFLHKCETGRAISVESHGQFIRALSKIEIESHIRTGAREDVYLAIDSERDYQESGKLDTNSHIVDNFNLGSCLSAIRINLDKAGENWYIEQEPYKHSMKYIRKIGAMCVQMGEKYSMPFRDEK